MMFAPQMKDRPKGFLADRHIEHSSEQFDYVRELHEILWRFVRTEYPGADGSLKHWIPIAIAAAERRAEQTAGRTTPLD
jgi:hypothetical protein